MLPLYIDAYEFLSRIERNQEIDKIFFDELIRFFRNIFFYSKNYEDRINKHRNPAEVCNEVLYEVHDYILMMDQRKEMQDIEFKNGISIHGYVPTRVIDIWKSDRDIKSLFNAVRAYCDQAHKDFRTIAVHIAERRAMVKVAYKIKRNLKKIHNNTAYKTNAFRHFGDINIINGESFFKAMTDSRCGNSSLGQISSADFEVRQFESKPLEGFQFPKDFPNCCEYHRKISQIGLEQFRKFPDCCEPHRKLATTKWFSKQNYSYLPHKLSVSLLYTWHCIEKCINNAHWFREITDYIEYTKGSYGQFPHGYGAPLGLDTYLFNLKEMIKATTGISDEKKAALLTYLEMDNSEVINEVEDTDINILLGKYKEWLKIFPFNIPFFAHLKTFFENRIPILSNESKTNLYTGVTGTKLTTKRQLVEFLISTTHELIKGLNSVIIYQSGQIIQLFEVKKEIIIASRKVEIEELDKADWDDRKGYVKMLKKWLQGEKKFLKEITPLFEKELYIANFIKSIIAGMRELQDLDTNADCILKVRNNDVNKETSFRYWFKSFLKGRHPDAIFSSEEEKGNGRIDLKATQVPYGCHIIEFKGWWNKDKINTPAQLCSYLTDFEKQGYIFMINHLKKSDITQAYKEIVTAATMNYLEGSWKEHPIENSDISYYESKHRFAIKEKTIFHFIFNVNFGNILKKDVN